MGTTQGVKIAAATLAGGSNNQDRYAHGEDWAFVLDGASSFAATKTHQDGGWYAERLRQVLSRIIPESKADSAVLVAQAITDAAAAFEGDPADCPTSTIALARWNEQRLETYVLGDSAAIIIFSDKTVKICTDRRISAIRPDLRMQYRSRLRQGAGFDHKHRAILAQLQFGQVAARNHPNGYWIAGSNPAAADQALRSEWPIHDINFVILATDGIFTAVNYSDDLNSLEYTHKPQQFLEELHRIESFDPRGSDIPRSKLHDDKTLVVVQLNQIS